MPDETLNTIQLQKEFLGGHDFVKLGQSIAHENWQIAGMTAQKMHRMAKAAGLFMFDRSFISMKQCIAHKNKQQAQDVLASVTAKRVQLLNNFEKEKL
ncbi:MAG: hypothetical protein GX567_09815 [Clostridia bacterium]|nr:hypothetical protein [Clostridia bacterium]